MIGAFTTRRTLALVERHVDGREIVEVSDRAAWRGWLAERHEQRDAIWLVFHKKTSDGTSPSYEEAVEEALCFGWVDSTAGVVDDEHGKLYFAPRKPRSAWAATNKARVDRLIRDGQMRPAGLAAIDRAKANGSWTILDTVERLEVPDDLAVALDRRPAAASNFAAFPPSARKAMLSWVAFARRPETRADRVAKIAEAAARNERAR